MWICPKCAAHNDDNTHLCPVCGTRLLSRPTGGSVPEYPAPVDPWAAHAETQAVVSPFDHTPTSGTPTSEGGSDGRPVLSSPISSSPHSGDPTPAGATFPHPTPTSPVPAPTRPFSGAIVPAPQPPTQPVTQYPMRPATIEVTQRTGIPLRWAITIAAVFLAGVGVAAAIVVPHLLSHDDSGGGNTTPANAAGSSGPGPAPSSDAPDDGLIVAIAPDITDGRADEVVAMLDVYFNGINAKDYDAVGSVLDPDGTTDPNDADDMNELADGTRSTKDSHVALTSLDDADDGTVSAEVTFQSNQKAGDGPADRPAETCTQWDITYTLSHDKVYRILQSDAASDPC